jgi:RNA polymerase sigma-70 factor (ECF subfamily)
MTTVSPTLRQRLDPPDAPLSLPLFQCFAVAEKTKRNENITSNLPDEVLLARLREEMNEERRDNFWEQLFQRHYRRIASWCYNIYGDRESARDLAQEIMIKVYRNLDSFRGSSKFTTWLYSITHNHCRNALRAACKEKRMFRPLDETCVGQHYIEPDLELALDMEQMKRLLYETLEPAELRVVILHYGEELTLAVVTKLLGLNNLSGAKAYIVSARRKLKASADRMRVRRLVVLRSPNPHLMRDRRD